MSEPDGPYAVVNQLELMLEGVERLTIEQRIQAWLDAQDDESTGAYLAHLYVHDRRSRTARAIRWQLVKSIQAPFDRKAGWLIPGGPESIWLYDEAVHAFVDGLPLASLLCSHAACERVLAGCLVAYGRELPPNWVRWGLGKLVAESSERNLIDEPMRLALLEVNEVRKVSAHFKPPNTENSLQIRTLARVDSADIYAESDDGWEQAFDDVAFEDAQTALRVATELARGEQGFARVRRY